MNVYKHFKKQIAISILLALFAVSCSGTSTGSVLDTTTTQTPIVTQAVATTRAPTTTLAPTTTRPTTTTVYFYSNADNVRGTLSTGGYGYLIQDFTDYEIDDLGDSVCTIANLSTSWEDFTIFVLAANSNSGLSDNEASALTGTILGAYCPWATLGWPD